jgi:hypothetical protein
MVWNRAPARLCSCSDEILAINSVPEEYTKSAPMTETIAAGNPNAQYGADGSIKANKRHAVVEPRVPVTDKEKKQRVDKRKKLKDGKWADGT